jgi:hypothetical protein
VGHFGDVAVIFALWVQECAAGGQVGRQTGLESNWKRLQKGEPLERIELLDWGGVMKLIPIVVGAEYRDGHSIRLTFSDGVENAVDFSGWLKGSMFEPLKDPTAIARPTQAAPFGQTRLPRFRDLEIPGT